MNGINKQGLKVLFTGAALQLFLGVIYVWSVFVRPVSDAYGWADADVKLTSSFMLCCFVLGILFGGRLQIKTGLSRMSLAGGVMLALAMLLTSLIPASAPVFVIYVTYGILGGLGVGAGYNAIITSAQKWFPKNRGFATGVSVCAFGFSTVVFAPLIEGLIGRFNLTFTLRILAAVFLAATLALFSFIKLPDEGQSPAAAGGKTGGGTGTSPARAGRQYETREMLKTTAFYFITISLMFGTATFFILNPSFKSMAVERGLSETIGTVVVMLTGVANALGRLAAPLVSDKFGRESADIAILSLTALAAVLLCFVQGAAFMAVIAVAAFCYGGYSGIYPVLTGDYFGMKNVGSNYGAVMVGFALSALTFPMIFGQIASETVKFIALGALAAAGAVLVALLKLVRNR